MKKLNKEFLSMVYEKYFEKVNDDLAFRWWVADTVFQLAEMDSKLMNELLYKLDITKTRS